ncbi:MAG: inosine/xanthosine triphosphatase [Chloroflexi bacterium]|nr:MAG: inosine/xanthosine triphosphatase [Chloroflexota bacterium]
MRIAVGSTNPVKVAAVTRVVRRLWEEAHVIPLDVPSGVRPQPMSDDEAIAGARNRAWAALRRAQADLGVGLEGSVAESPYGLFLTGWAVVVSREGREGIASGGRLVLPETVARRVRAGEELGPVMDDLVGERNTKQARGAVGILTNGLIVRTAAFEQMVAYALVPFLHPDWYSGGE